MGARELDTSSQINKSTLEKKRGYRKETGIADWMKQKDNRKQKCKLQTQ